MFFANRLSIASAESQFQNPSETARWFRRQFRTCALMGHGVALNAGSIADILDAEKVFEDDEFLETCLEIQSQRTPGSPLIVVRGLQGEKADLLQFFHSRPPDWILSSLGGKPKSELTSFELDSICTRLTNLSDRLSNVDAKPEGISPAAAGRLARHVDLNIATQRTWRGRQAITVPLSRRDFRLEITFDELSTITRGAPSRSSIYTSIDKLVNEKRNDLKTSIDDTELNEGALQLVGEIKNEFVDRAYNSIFFNPNESLIEGRCELGDPEVLLLVTNLVRTIDAGRTKINAYLDRHRSFRSLPEVLPQMLKRLHIILLAFSSHSASDIFSELALAELSKAAMKPLAAIGWMGFRHHYTRMAAQPFSQAWDSEATMARLSPRDDGLASINSAIDAAEIAEDIRIALRDFQEIPVA